MIIRANALHIPLADESVQLAGLGAVAALLCLAIAVLVLVSLLTGCAVQPDPTEQACVQGNEGACEIATARINTGVAVFSIRPLFPRYYAPQQPVQVPGFPRPIELPPIQTSPCCSPYGWIQ